MGTYNIKLRKSTNLESFDWWSYCANRAEHAQQYSFHRSKDGKMQTQRQGRRSDNTQQERTNRND